MNYPFWRFVNEVMECYATPWRLLFNKKEGVEVQFPEVTENYLCEKLWNHLDKRELRNFGSIKG